MFKIWYDIQACHVQFTGQKTSENEQELYKIYLSKDVTTK